MNDTAYIAETAASMADLLDYAPPVPEAPKVRLPKRERPSIRLRELPEEFDAIEEMMARYYGWQALSSKTNTPEAVRADAEAHDALGMELEERLEAFSRAVAANGKQYRDWLRNLRADAEAKAKEAADLNQSAEIAKRKFERIKALVKNTLRALGLDRLRGAGWELSVVGNGGIAPFEWKGDGPIPLEFAQRIEVDPAELTRRVEELLDESASRHASPVMSPHGLLAYLLDGDPQLEASSTKFYEAVKKHGETPDGFEILPRGVHLEVK